MQRIATISLCTTLPLLIAVCGVGCEQPVRVADRSDSLAPNPGQEPQPIAEPMPDETQGPIENLLTLAPGLFSGSEPGGQDGYEQLQKMGVRTLISVDAIAPNAQLANLHNIRVIHLPIGYEGISEQRIKELAYAINSAPRPIYVHCHQGKHRGPAAICAGAIASGDITLDQAIAFMTKAGTSSQYRGLWSSVEQTRAFEVIEPTPLRRRVRTEGINKTMSKIGVAYEHLWDMADIDFEPLEDHPDLTPVSLAAQIHDHLRSLDTPKLEQRRGPYFYEDLLDAIDAASALEQTLETGERGNWKDALESLDTSCVDCHSTL